MPAKSLDISVIICTWNRISMLQNTLCALAASDASFNWELIVVDNNSQDETRETVLKAAQDSSISIKYIFEGRQGKQFALNSGIAAARGELLAFTDDDILVSKSWLSQANATMADKRIDLLGGQTMVEWGVNGPPAWYSKHLGAVVGEVSKGPAAQMPAPSTFSPAGANMIVRRSLFDRIGLFSEAHFRHMDEEFGFRAHARGAFVAYDPALVVHAPVDERCLTQRYFKRWAFKAGLDRSGGAGAAGRRPAVPGWIYRQYAQDMLLSAAERLYRSEAEVFARRFRAWRAWGTIANAWHGWLRPHTHAKWVEAKSQKRGDLY